MIRWGASMLVPFLLTPTTLTSTVSAAVHATRLFRLADSQLDEISGIAAGIRSPNVVYVQNDSGDLARFFALDKTSGRLLAQYAVPDAVNIDWEDIAVAPDAHGTPSVWLADIGDNDRQRKQIQLYRVDEPRVPMTGHDAQLAATQPDVWRLRYPDGPHDAESLAVSPTGVPYVITKSATGTSEVFAATSRNGTQTLRKVGTIRFHLTGTPGPFAPLGELTATGADPREIETLRRGLGVADAEFPPVNSTKSMIGHALGAAGAIECVAALLEMRHGFLHPSLNCEDLHPAIGPVAASVVRQARPADVRFALKTSFGFGDVNACVIFARWPE